MHPGRFLAFIAAEEADRSRRNDEAFRAWHRLPDALPIVDQELDPATGNDAGGTRRTAGSRGTRRVGAAWVIDRLVGWSLAIRR